MDRRKMAVFHFIELLRCETIHGKEEEFNRLLNILKVNYPLIYKNCDCRQIGGRALLYRWKGRVHNKSVVLMSHYDVVSAQTEDWTCHPFSGEIREGRIWGRGTLDTKGSLCGIMESVEGLMEEGFVPRCDVYLCFGGDEETEGDGARQIVEELRKKGVSPFLVLDEGGAVVNGSAIGVPFPCALVGIAEKGYMDMELVAKSKGGHTSIPQRENAMETMAKAITRLSRRSFPIVLSPPTLTMLKAVAKHMDLQYRLLMKNEFVFKAYINMRMAKAFPEIDALFRTTCNVTRIEGSKANNVIPERVRAVGNFRIVCGSTMHSTINRVKGLLEDLDVEIRILEGRNPSVAAPVEGKGWDMLLLAISKTWKNATVIPYTLLAASDARSYQELTPYVYRFSPIRLRKGDRSSIHGSNESIAIKDFYKLMDFYTCLIKQL